MNRPIAKVRKVLPAEGKLPTVYLIPLAKIKCDQTLQIRVTEHEEQYIEELAVRVRERKHLSPIALFKENDGQLWLADGHARFEAYSRAKAHDIPAVIH